MNRRNVLALMSALVFLVVTAGAQSQVPTIGMLDKPVILRTAAATVKVSAIKGGLVYPWALAFLPDGDMLVTEQGKNTLRRISNGPRTAARMYSGNGFPVTSISSCCVTV